MFSGKILNNRAGLLIYGDYSTLQTLRDVVEQVNATSVLTKKSTWLSDLAKSAQSALDRKQDVIPPKQFYEEPGTRFGFKTLWPVILVQSRVLRQSFDFIRPTRLHYAIAFALEDLIETLLRVDFEERGDDTVDCWRNIDTAHPAALELLNSRGALYASWDGDSRKKYMNSLLHSLSVMYSATYDIAVKNGRGDLIEPSAFEKWEKVEKWPDPKW